MKKILCICFAFCMLCTMFAACSRHPSTDATKEPDVVSGQKLKIVATIFPTYDWVRNILGDRLTDTELTLLLDNGVDLHSYQPTASDIMRISDCDLFVYVGGASDKWTEDVLTQAAGSDLTAVNLLQVLGDRAKEEVVKEGMEDETEEPGTEEEIEYDEHVWLSLSNAVLFCNALCDALCEIDPAYADVYTANTAAYTNELSALDMEYASALETSPVKTLVFGDRFPFRYLTDAYGLDYYAAFTGCSAETEASFETVTFLVNKIDELGLDCLFAIEGTNHKLAETIAKETASGEKKIFVLNSLQSVTSADVDAGADYLQIMRNNLNVLKDALLP
ncbi:MAG: zinc ABC transporter substrate-binding protein [Clostridia bacterium]|nr:zinc ABC transporter substrate-binding protein [Clostridia bacterium]